MVPPWSRRAAPLLVVAAAGMALAACAVASGRSDLAPPGDWRIYAGTAEGDRYSPLTQINTGNVAGLEEAWRFDTGAGALQTTPLIVDGRLFGVTPTQGVFALDPATGAKLWAYEPAGGARQPTRGLTYWQAGAERRLFSAHGQFLIALDPYTGEPAREFGDNGKVDLRHGLGRDPATLSAVLTTPGVIYRDLIIVGFRTSENAPAAPGAVRAYDVRTGQLRWTFNLVPRPGEPGHETWPADAWKTAGGANVWAGMVVDEARGIVFAPSGSAADDFYGADRAGDNLYANALVALDANTGKRLWHFQAVHHDLWDRDFPSPPVLLTVRRDGKRIDAVAQPSKQGVLFVFDRVTGEPLFPIEERPVPQTDVPGEVTAPTQPFPLKPAPYARQWLTPDLLTNRTPQARAEALAAYAGFKNQGPFTPLTVGAQTVIFPGFDGGAEWGGPAVDRKRGVIYINSNDIAWLGGLTPAKASAAQTGGGGVYQKQCSSCHGASREGAPPAFPGLLNIAARLSATQIDEIIVEGRGRMPGFPQIAAADRAALVRYLRDEPDGEAREVSAPTSAKTRPAYRFTGYRKFLDAEGYPAVAPPWGSLNAIDLNTGEDLWKVPLGEYPALKAQGVPITGTENYGGPVVTAGGVLFIGATLYDRKLRAFDSRTGKTLWEGDLPFAGVATPAVYMAGGRQYVVIAASGSRDPKGPKGSAYVAFALPSGRPAP